MDEQFSIQGSGHPPPPATRPPRWGGHSLRRTGAQEYHRLGITLEVIKKLGRWCSAAVQGCIAGLPFDMFREAGVRISDDAIHVKIDTLANQIGIIAATLEDLMKRAKIQSKLRKEGRGDR